MPKTPLLLELDQPYRGESASSSHAPLLFLRSLLSNPLKVGALAPSSPKLSRLMASRVDAETAPVLEVGAGTGVITRALLRKELPGVHVRCGEALDAGCILAKEAIGRVQTVVSSLPLRNLPPEDQIDTVQAMMSALAQGGQLIQFTYAAGCPIPSQKLGLKAERLGRVWMNFPPAAVWRFTRNLTALQRFGQDPIRSLL